MGKRCGHDRRILARRFQYDPEWWPLSAPAIATSGVTGLLLAVYASGVVEPWNGVVQRVAVTIPGASMAGLAVRLLRHHGPVASRAYPDHQPRALISDTKRR